MAAERPLRALFEPGRVAVVGASTRAGSPGDVVWRNLSAFPGEVVPISSSLSEVRGVPAFGSLREVPRAVDLAVVVVTASAVPAVIEDAVAANVGACVVVSAGFAETGAAGRALQERIVATARAGGMRLAGPNCLGVQNWSVGLNASLAAGSARPGGIAVLTQSGSYAMALHALSADDGARFSVGYSVGNRADIGDAEVLDYLQGDPATTVVAALVESIVDGPAFLDAARRLVAAGKPVVVAPLGRSEAGARAAASHTAALAGGRAVWRDLLTEAGVTVVGSGQELLDAARLLHDQPRARGARVGVVTNSGGTGTELADLLAEEGLAVPALSPGLQAELAALLPGYASTVNPVDITPVWTRFPELYPAVVSALARSGEVDVVIAVLLHRSADSAVSTALAEEVGRLRAVGHQVPVVGCWVAPRAAWSQGDPLRAAGIAVMDGPARTARAVGHLCRADRPLAPLPDEPCPESNPPSRPKVDAPEAIATWVRSWGVPVVETAVVTDVPEAQAAARRTGLPVVAKVVHAELPHKSDVGGVRLWLTSIDEVGRAAAELLALRSGARVAISPQRRGVELLVGAFRDPTFGPVVAFGPGGVLVELLDAAGFARAPLSAEAASGLLTRSRCRPLLDGYRGSPRVDHSALIDLLISVGRLIAAEDRVLALDLNPVLAGPGGCVAVDVRVTPTAE